MKLSLDKLVDAMGGEEKFLAPVLALHPHNEGWGKFIERALGCLWNHTATDFFAVVDSGLKALSAIGGCYDPSIANLANSLAWEAVCYMDADEKEAFLAEYKRYGMIYEGFGDWFSKTAQIDRLMGKGFWANSPYTALALEGACDVFLNNFIEVFA